MNCNGELAIIKNFITDQSVVFDVGVHKGEWTDNVLTMHLDKSLLIYAFEPNPISYESVARRFGGEKNIHVYCCAVSDIEGVGGLHAYNTGAGSGDSLFSRPVMECAYESTVVPVALKTLDMFTREHSIQKIDFIKIDTEGSELNILVGAQRLLQTQSIKAIQFEYGGKYPDAGITFKQVYDLLQSYKYRVYRIAPDCLVYIENWHPELENSVYSNYLAVPF